MKVRRSKIVNEHETERERLLSEDSDEGQGSRSRSSSKTKLLGDCDERVYSSCSDDTGNGSCVKCSEGCKEQTDKYTAKGLFVNYKFLINPIGAVCSGSTLFASVLNLSVMIGNYLQQTKFSDALFSWRFKG